MKFRAPLLQSLESRLLFCLTNDGPAASMPLPHAPSQQVQQDLQSVPPSTASTSYTVAGSLAVPVFNSRPGAFAKLYLDFDGDITADWGAYHPLTTLAYDIDSNP